MNRWIPPGQRPYADLELEAKYAPREPEPIWVRFQAALIGLGLSVAVLVAVSIIGWLA